MCIQARFDTYQISFLILEIQRKTLNKRAPNTALRLTHVRERKLAVPPFRLFRDHVRGKKYIWNSRRSFDVYVFVLNSNS